MKRFTILSVLLLTWVSACTQIPAAWLTSIGGVQTKIGDDARWASASFEDSGWSRMHWAQISSYERIVWLRAHVDAATLPSNRDVTVTVSAVAAYEVFWNGTRVGASGRPAATRAAEIPGPMVANLVVPAALVTAGDNVLAVRLSSMHLPARLLSTVHVLTVSSSLDPAIDPMTLRLYAYVPGIAASGALLLGACYFAALFWSDRRDRAAAYLALLAFAALGQFVAEAWAAFVNYQYPAHLYRLWTVLAMACAYGFALVAYVSERCARARQSSALAATAAGTAAVIAFTPGYDSKTTLIIVVAAAVSLACALAAQPRRWLLLFAPVGLLSLFLLAPLRFIDEQFYLVTAAAIILLFFEQVRHLRGEQAARAAAELRSARMELELLKRYIQPHFLLNTLTSLAEWVETDPRVGVRMIEALAEEFRVLSRIGAQRTIELRDEVALCQLHLQVMSLRHDAPMELAATGLDDQQQVPPAILHTLIENALTHNHYPQGATFRLHERCTAEVRSYELWCPPGREQAPVPTAPGGTGLDYVRARLTEVFADRWCLSDGRAADGGWLTRIDVPAR